MVVNVEERIRIPKRVVGKEAIGEAKFIATHDGAFHCDDCLAVACLIQLPQYKDSTICRTRDKDTLAKAEIVVDVGGEYDPERLRLDHHQKGFEEFFDQSWKKATKMSSAGMVWKHLGKDIIKEITQLSNEDDITAVWKALYEQLFESVDAIDNGINAVPAGSDPLYIVRTDLTSRIARFNLEWTDPTVDYICADRFIAAVKCASQEFLEILRGTADLWLPARTIVKEALEQRFQVHPMGRVIELKQQCPWELHLHELEEEMKLIDRSNENSKRMAENSILFVIHKGYGGDWRVRAVRESTKSFGNRMDICPKLKGLRDEELQKEAPGVNFIHNAGFLAGCKTREAALNLIEMTLNCS